MIRYDVKKFKDGSTKTQLRVTWGYRDPVTHKVKQVTKKHFGYLEDAKDKNILIKEAEDYNNSLKSESSIKLNLKSSKPFYESDSSLMYNFGYKYLDAIYNELEIDKVFDNIPYNGKTPLKEIFKLLVFSRILTPSSKRSTFQTCQNFFDLDIKSLSLSQIYRSLDYFYSIYDKLQDFLDKKVEEKIGRSREEMFLDVTNYMTSIDFNDEDFFIPKSLVKEYNENLIEKDKKGNLVIYELEFDGETNEYYKVLGTRKTGVSKSHSISPIVSLGLLMDNNSLPVRAEMFAGNTSDSLELQPIIRKIIKENKSTKKLIVIADKGLNSGNNISFLLENGCGYIFSQVLKGKKGKRYHEKMFEKSNYTVVSPEYKYQMFDEDYNYVNSNGENVSAKRKVLIYYSKKEAIRAEKKRNEKVNKAEKYIKSGAYKLDHSYKKYVKVIPVDNNTGELKDDVLASVDYEKIEREKKFDGYFCIITSELDFTEEMLRTKYHGLWRIEESFKITKSTLNTHPIFLSNSKHIQAHFLICFTALLIIRILQFKLDYKISVNRIINALKTCCLTRMDQGLIHIVMNENKVKLDNKDIDKELRELTANQTIEDYIKVNKLFGNNTISSLVSVTDFNNFIKKLKIKL